MKSDPRQLWFATKRLRHNVFIRMRPSSAGRALGEHHGRMRSRPALTVAGQASVSIANSKPRKCQTSSSGIKSKGWCDTGSSLKAWGRPTQQSLVRSMHSRKGTPSISCVNANDTSIHLPKSKQRSICGQLVELRQQSLGWISILPEETGVVPVLPLRHPSPGHSYAPLVGNRPAVGE